MTKTSLTYAAAGVDISQAVRTKKRIAALARRTFTPAVLGGIGGFSALYALNRREAKFPVLVASSDGIGTKLKVAFATGRHRSVAADLVNHCVNDIAVQGARPLFFLDYIGSGRIDPTVIEQIISGLSDGCRVHGCSLIGGETAEMPGFYADGEYDLAGFIVGLVERDKVLTGSRVRAGNLLIGLPSMGLHTNGYSLARKLLLETAGYRLEEKIPRLNRTAAEELLQPHRSYARPIHALLDADLLRGAAHITGGGIPGNLPRILPRGLHARIDVGSWPHLPLFSLLREIGNVPDDDMWKTFNMGLGMILVIPRRALEKASAVLRKIRQKFFVIGSIAKGGSGVRLERSSS